MLTNNKTYDDSNLRYHLKVFNDGVVDFYEASERVLKKLKAHFYYAVESISYETYLEASQNSKRDVIAIAIPAQGETIEHGDIAKIGDKFYQVDHVQYKDYNLPHYYKVFLYGLANKYVVETGE